MKYLIFLFVVFLSGCYQSINYNDIEMATKICKSYNSVVIEVDSFVSGSESVICSNRNSYNIDFETIEKITEFNN
jgi:hypothetical protein